MTNFSTQAGLGTFRQPTIPDPEHWQCSAVGKFDCTFDEAVHDLTMEDGAGEGDVSSNVAWFAEVTLTEDERGLMDHYGTRWLIAREFNDGRFAVEGYLTEQSRDERLEGLRDAFSEWAGDVL